MPDLLVFLRNRSKQFHLFRGLQCLEQGDDAFLKSRQDKMRSDLAEWLEDEFSLVGARVRKGQFGRCDGAIPKCDQV